MSVRFRTRSASTAAELGVPAETILLHGPKLDDRGTAACEIWGDSCMRALVSYNVDRMTLQLGDVVASADAATDLFGDLDVSKIVLEATTLGFAELFSMIRALVQLKTKRIEVIYVEPVDYSRLRPGGDQFALSELTKGYQPIPNSVVDLTSDELDAGVFFLGYESERLERALEEHQMITAKDIKVVFGIPAFHPGWELDSIIPHMPIMTQRGLEIDYCAANDPEAAFECLERTRSSLAMGKRMFIAPIGTKPCGIATAVFASVYADQVGLLFDHPRRSKKRSEGASRWHRFSVLLG